MSNYKNVVVDVSSDLSNMYTTLVIKVTVKGAGYSRKRIEVDSHGDL